MRRKCFEKGEYPSHERLPGNSLQTSLILDEPEVGKEPESIQGVAPEAPVVFKTEPKDAVSLPRNQSAVIDLGDSDDDALLSELRRAKRPLLAAIPIKQPTINSSPLISARVRPLFPLYQRLEMPRRSSLSQVLLTSYTNSPKSSRKLR